MMVFLSFYTFKKQAFIIYLSRTIALYVVTYKKLNKLIFSLFEPFYHHEMPTLISFKSVVGLFFLVFLLSCKKDKEEVLPKEIN